jgi:N-acetylglucosamine-6-phosphate deacetylase
VVLAGTDRLAGSALRLDRGVDNLMRLCGLRLADAVRMATVNAARAGGVPGRCRGLEPGDRADFVQFRLTPQVEVVGTRVSGRKVF